MGQNRRRVVLIALLSVAFSAPSRAESVQAAGDQIVIGIVVVSAAVAVGVTLLILHQKHKNSEITGCVTAGVNGMSVMDDKNKRVYALTGDPAGIKPGDQMALDGKRRAESGKMPVFEARSVIKDLGVCH
jgi:hypothetical protein